MAPVRRDAQLDAWSALASPVADPAFELTVEEFGAIRRAFDRLRRRGRAFDPMLGALLACLAREAGGTDDGLEDVDELARHSATIGGAA